MNRNLFHEPWHDQVCGLVTDLDRALSNKFGVANARRELERVRNDLHVICQWFEFNGYAEDHGVIYIDLFDALSYLTEGLAAHPVNRGFVDLAQGKLRAIRDLAVPA